MKTLYLIAVVVGVVLSLVLVGCSVRDDRTGVGISPPPPVPSPVFTPPPPAPRPTNLPPPIQELHPVIRVSDGDTVTIDQDGEPRTYRVIGIDTPETVKPNWPVECYGPEASAEAKRLLQGQYVAVYTDASQGVKDRYGRWLGYLTLPDGTDFGLHMIQNGYAKEARYGSDYDRMAEYREADAAARAAGIGRWGACPQ